MKNFILMANGVWPTKSRLISLMLKQGFPKVNTYIWTEDSVISIEFQSENIKLVVPKEDFISSSKILGYINGYRWGVEYPTNYKKPNLPDDLVVCTALSENDTCEGIAYPISMWMGWDSVAIYSFKIVDERYKPADTSYLSVSEIPESKSNAENVSDWYDYEAQKAVALPPVGVECEYLARDEEKDKWINCFVIGFDTDGKGLVCKLKRDKGYEYIPCYSPIMRPLDHNRKAEAEKKRVVDAATEILYKHACATKGELIDGAKALYDLGYLRLPEQK